MNGNQVAVKIATTLIARETAKKFLLKWRFDNRKQYQKAAISIYMHFKTRSGRVYLQRSQAEGQREPSL